MNQNLSEITTNLISEGTKVQGQITFEHITRVHGTLIGDVTSQDGSTLIIGETGVIEGNVFADTLMVDGFIRGDVKAKTKVFISGTGRVIGNIEAPSLEVDFGAYFEGRCNMERALSPAT